ncbi:MAG TPA: sulfatase-like hydrolase/transferase, partial [Pyrinomonadaceae bacterium]|nr:sulfatase-like hydrolase/transferase [Pyrinomonadaceae bacterium]
GEPRKQGYDYFFGYLDQQHAHDYYPSYLWRNEEKIELGKKVYSHTLFEKETLDFIESSKGGPFFMYLPFTLPHANNELGRATGNGMQVPTDAPYSSEPWSPQQRNYAAMVTMLDATVGKIRDTLKKLGLEDDTIIIFTSDNGPQSVVEGGYDQTLFQSNGGLRGLKRSLYEGGIREPLIFYWKGKIKPNRSSDAVWAQYDFLPTFAEIAGAKLTEKTDGISMVPLLFGKKHRKHDFLYFEFYEGGFIQAVRMGDWKGFRRGLEGKLELYNLKKDPRESDNIASKNPKTVAKIEAIMAREHVPSDNWAADDGD